MLLHPLTNFEIQKYYENYPRFNGVYSRNNLSTIKDGTYIINLNEKALYVNTENVTNFSSFGAEHILEEIKNLIGKKNIMANIYRIQACDSIM